jgi:multiple sugar transport system ATP-binding protein
MAAVELEGVGKVYPGGVRAVEDLHLTAAAGELLVLVGPSGCGKTTLLRLIAGLETPTTGSVRLGSRDVRAVPPYQRAVALVFQRPALYPHLTVRQNLAFALELERGLWVGRAARQEICRRVEEVAGQLHLEALLERRPSELAGGQQQRVALGRALVRRPAVLLLDEPLASLDEPLRRDMRRELHLLQRRLRATMIYVTHDQEEALALGDRVAVLHQGRLCQAAAPEQLFGRPRHRFVAGFIGWPPMNLLDGVLQGQRDGLTLVRGKEKWALPGRLAGPFGPYVNRPVSVGFRSEQVCLDMPQGQSAWTVEAVEQTGGECLVVLRQGDWHVTVRRPALDTPAAGQPVALGWDGQDAFLFDQATGQRLWPALAEED